MDSYDQATKTTIATGMGFVDAFQMTGTKSSARTEHAKIGIYQPLIIQENPVLLVTASSSDGCVESRNVREERKRGNA